MALSSDEVNYLLYRYLQECGFSHSAFTFAAESLVHRANINGADVPPGALVAFIQKGIQFLEIEASLDGDGIRDVVYESPLDLLQPNKVQMVKGNAKSRRGEKSRTVKGSQPTANGSASAAAPSAARGGASAAAGSSTTTTTTTTVTPVPAASAPRSAASAAAPPSVVTPMGVDVAVAATNTALSTSIATTTNAVASSSVGSASGLDNDGPGGAFGLPTPTAEAMDEDEDDDDMVDIIPDRDVTILEGHAGEVFTCAWNTVADSIASGSGDATARIWHSRRDEHGATLWREPIVLEHFSGESMELDRQQRDVTTLDWSHDGKLLATGSYDGIARIWNAEGHLLSTLIAHRGPIFSLKWNRRDDYLLSGSVDHTAIIWDVKSGTAKQEFEFHTAPTLDVDWRNDTTFATCSTDRLIFVCELGADEPIQVFQGHSDEVNAIKWDPTGDLLASCSDDLTAKIWKIGSNDCQRDFREHTKEIYTIKWSPTGPGTRNPNLPKVLASASLDTTIKVWDVEAGQSKFTLTNHTDPVYSVAFSPNGEYLASGSFDQCLHIWSMRDGRLVRTYRGNGGIFEVAWNAHGDKVAASFSNHTVAVLDIRM